MKDAKEKQLPSWARYIEELPAVTAYLSHEVNGLVVPFALYCSGDAVVELTPIENENSITIDLAKGYHTIACRSITSSNVKLYLLYADRPRVDTAIA